jgi:hypothetical protein
MMGEMMKSNLLSAVVLVACLATSATTKAEDFTGFYAGVLLSDTPSGNNDRLSAGVLSGYRFSLTDSVRLGVEGKASVGLDSLATQFWNATASGSLGLVVENTFFFAKAGASTETYVGFFNTGILPTVGVGLEFAPNDEITFRGEANSSWDLANPSRPLYSVELAFGVIKYF